VVVFKSTAAAQSYFKEDGATPGFSKTKVGGQEAYEYLGPESGVVSEKSLITDKRATEAVVAVAHVDTVFLIGVIAARRATATSFVASFHLA